MLRDVEREHTRENCKQKRERTQQHLYQQKTIKCEASLK